MYLIAREFGMRALTRDHNRAALGIHFDGVMISGFERQKEERAQHFDHVVVGMLIVVEQDYMEERLKTLSVVSSGLRSSGGGWQPFKW